MSDKIKIILARANWCGHCKDFEPIYDLSQIFYKNNKFLKEYNINFENYDMADNDIKNKFMLNHFNAMDQIEGYPTILINIKNKENNKYYNIQHTVRDYKISNNKEQIENAALRFLDNISNKIKSLNSDNKILYTQTGGKNQNELYKKKYLKYKSKYLNLKN